MKRTRLLLVIASVLLSSPAHATVIVSILPGDTTLQVGDSITLELRADLSQDTVIGFGLDLVFDAAQFQWLDLTIAAPFEALFAPDGDGFAAVAPFAGPPSGSDVLLATVTLRALLSGVGFVTAGVTPGDLTEGFPLLGPPGSFAEASFGTARIEVPEPDALLLFGMLAIFAGLAGVRPRRGRARSRRACALGVAALALWPASLANAEITIRCEAGNVPSLALLTDDVGNPVIQTNAVSRDAKTIVGFSGGRVVEFFGPDFAGNLDSPIDAVSGTAQNGDIFLGKDAGVTVLWDNTNLIQPLADLGEGSSPVALSRDGGVGVGAVTIRETICSESAPQLQSAGQPVRWFGADALEVLDIPRSAGVASDLAIQLISDSQNPPWVITDRSDLARSSVADASDSGAVVVGSSVETTWASAERRFCNNDRSVLCEHVSECPPQVPGGPTRSCEDRAFECDDLVFSSQAFRWAGSQTQLLGFLSDGPEECGPREVRLGDSTASAVSGDGKVVVGTSRKEPCSGLRTGFRWTQQDGMEELLPINHLTTQLKPEAASYDGRTLLGTLSISGSLAASRCPGGCPTRTEAFIWDEANGTRFLRDALRDDYNVTVNGWHLTDVEAWREGLDDTLLVGMGYAPSGVRGAWWIRLPCPDPDRDGLCSRWEIEGGIDLNEDGEISDCVDGDCPDLRLKDADPLRKDIFVEIDQLRAQPVETLPLLPQTLMDVAAAFADVPSSLVENVDPNVHGIKLHLEVDEAGLTLADGTVEWYTAGACAGPKEPVWTDTIQGSFGSPAQRQNAEVIDAKSRIYRHGIYGGTTVPCTNGFGVVSQPNFVVGDTGQTIIPIGAQPVALMHEIGHTLGLRHGGPDDLNGKPNYRSIMNYVFAYQANFSGPLAALLLRGSWRLDYSRRRARPLSEFGAAFGNLDETRGIGGHAGRFAPIGPVLAQPGPNGLRVRVVPEIGPIDFNVDGVIETAPVVGASLRVDSDEYNLSREENRPYAPRPPTILEPSNDWEQIAGQLCSNYQSPTWGQVIRDPSALVSSPAEEIPLFSIDDLDLFLDCNENGISDDDDLAGGLDMDSNGNGLLDGCEPLAGDLDVDGDVDEDDRTILLAAFGYGEGEPEYVDRADIDLDAWVTFVDYQFWLAAYADFQAGQTAPLASSCGLLGVEAPLLLWLAGRRANRRQARRSAKATAR